MLKDKLSPKSSCRKGLTISIIATFIFTRIAMSTIFPIKTRKLQKGPPELLALAYSRCEDPQAYSVTSFLP